MKNQYFGDIHDYRKYGLLRSIIEATQLRLLVAWMLTPDDGGSDGSRLSYLNKPLKWGKQWRLKSIEPFDVKYNSRRE